MPTVALQDRRLLVDGHPVYISGGEIQYFRLPRAAWRDCLATARAGGLNTVTSYMRVPQTQAQIQQCLADGYPVVFGFTVYESFESDVVARTGVVPMPGKREKVLGGHAVVCVGYDRSKKAFLVRNSWGTSWGQGGYFWMPFAYLTNNNLADDLWTVRMIKG